MSKLSSNDRQLLSILAHELRTPVAVLQAESQVVFTDTSGVADPEFLLSVQEEARSLQRTIDDALALIELRLLEEKPDTEMVDLPNCLAEVVASLQRDARMHDVELHVAAPEADAILRVPANAHVIRSMLGALVREAISTSREKSKVTLGFKQADDAAVFVINWHTGRSESEQLIDEIIGQRRAYSPGSSIRCYLSNFIAEYCGFDLNLDFNLESRSSTRLSIPSP